MKQGKYVKTSTIQLVICSVHHGVNKIKLLKSSGHDMAHGKDNGIWGYLAMNLILDLSCDTFVLLGKSLNFFVG